MEYLGKDHVEPAWVDHELQVRGVLRGQRLHRAGDPARGGRRVPSSQNRAQTQTTVGGKFGLFIMYRVFILLLCIISD